MAYGIRYEEAHSETAEGIKEKYVIRWNTNIFYFWFQAIISLELTDKFPLAHHRECNHKNEFTAAEYRIKVATERVETGETTVHTSQSAVTDN